MGDELVAEQKLLPVRFPPAGEQRSAGAALHPPEPALPRPHPHLRLHPPQQESCARPAGGRRVDTHKQEVE